MRLLELEPRGGLAEGRVERVREAWLFQQLEGAAKFEQPDMLVVLSHTLSEWRPAPEAELRRALAELSSALRSWSDASSPERPPRADPGASTGVIEHPWRTAPGGGEIPSGAGAAPAIDGVPAGVMRAGGLAGIGLIFACIPLLLVHVGVALVGMFVGSALFWLANYVAYRNGEPSALVGPAIASRLFVGSLFLAVVALVASLTT